MKINNDKTAVVLEQHNMAGNPVPLYKVTQLTNRTVPHVGKTLDEPKVQELIDSGIKVTIKGK